MAWTPDDRDLVMVWMAYKELHELGLAQLNLSNSESKGIPSNARDFLVEYSDRRMDVMCPPGSCVVPVMKLLDHLAKERGTGSRLLPADPKILFEESDIRAELEELKRVDQLIREAAEGGGSLGDIVRKAVSVPIGTIPHLLKNVGELLLAVVGMGGTAFMVLVWVDNTEARLPFLIVGVLAYVSSTLILLEGVINPSKFYYDYERFRAVNKGKTPFGFVAGVVAFLCASFVVVTHVLWRMTDGSFMVATSPAPLEWVLYGFDNLVRAVVFDFAEIYRLKISKIEHADGWLASTLVFAFRTTIGLTAISLLIEAWRRYLNKNDGLKKGRT